jgi:MFS family permease
MTHAPLPSVPKAEPAPLTERRYLLPFLLVISLFFLWAFGVNLNDILIPHLKRAFGLTDFQSSFIQVAFFGGYFLAAFPAGWAMERIGYKKGILLGLLLCATGAVLFLPASSYGVYGFFLFALFVMACGQSFLEVAANPYATALGPAGSAERRLNFAQSFNATGAVLSSLLGRAFILTGVEYAPAQLAAMSSAQLAAFRASEASTVKGPYLAMAGIFVLLAVVFQFTHLPDVSEAGEKSDAAVSLAEAGSVLAHKHLVRGVIAQFFYVGAQVGVASFVIRLAFAPDRFHSGPLYRLCVNETCFRTRVAVLVCRRGFSLCGGGSAGVGRLSGCGRRVAGLLSLHHVPDDFRAEHQGPGAADETRFVATGDGHHWRRCVSRAHGTNFGRRRNPEGVRGSAALLSVRSLFRDVGI